MRGRQLMTVSISFLCFKAERSDCMIELWLSFRFATSRTLWGLRWHRWGRRGRALRHVCCWRDVPLLAGIYLSFWLRCWGRRGYRSALNPCCCLRWVSSFRRNAERWLYLDVYQYCRWCLRCLCSTLWLLHWSNRKQSIAHQEGTGLWLKYRRYSCRFLYFWG